MTKNETHRLTKSTTSRVSLEWKLNGIIRINCIDRDLNNPRIVFDIRVIDVGRIVTGSTHLQHIFKVLGKKVADKYGASTTHMDKLLPRLEGGGGGGCPFLAFGITREKYVEDAAPIDDQQLVEGDNGDSE